SVRSRSARKPREICSQATTAAAAIGTTAAPENQSVMRPRSVILEPPPRSGAALQLRWVYVTRYRAWRLRLARGSRLSAPLLAGSFVLSGPEVHVRPARQPERVEDEAPQALLVVGAERAVRERHDGEARCEGGARSLDGDRAVGELGGEPAVVAGGEGGR